MSTAPFTPGPEGSVIDDQEVSVSGAMELADDVVDFNLKRGQVVEITMRGEVVATREVDKTVSGGREVTVRQWAVKASGLQAVVKIADPAPRKTPDGQIPGQESMDDAVIDAGAVGGMSDADEKARMNRPPPPSPEVAAQRRAEMAAADAHAEEAAGRGPEASTLAEAAHTGVGRVLHTLPNGEPLAHGQRWMTPEGKTFVLDSAGTQGDDVVIVGHYLDTGAVDSFPPQSFGSTLAAIDQLPPAAPVESATGNAPATSPDDLS